MRTELQVPIKITVTHALANAVESEFLVETISEIVHALEQLGENGTKVYALFVSTHPFLVQLYPAKRVSPKSILERNLLATYTGYVGFITVSWAGELNKPHRIHYTVKLEHKDDSGKHVLLSVGDEQQVRLMRILEGGPKYRNIVYCEDVLGYGALAHGTNIDVGTLKLVGANSNCYGYPVIKKLFDRPVHLVNNPIAIAQTKEDRRFTYVLTKQDTRLYETKTQKAVRFLVSGAVVTLSELLEINDVNNARTTIVETDIEQLTTDFDANLDILPELQELTGVDTKDTDTNWDVSTVTGSNTTDELLVNTHVTLDELVDRFVTATNTDSGLILYDTFNILPSTIECLILERGLLRISDTGLFLLSV